MSLSVLYLLISCVERFLRPPIIPERRWLPVDTARPPSLFASPLKPNGLPQLGPRTVPKWATMRRLSRAVLSQLLDALADPGV